MSITALQIVFTSWQNGSELLMWTHESQNSRKVEVFGKANFQELSKAASIIDFGSFVFHMSKVHDALETYKSFLILWPV